MHGTMSLKKTPEYSFLTIETTRTSSRNESLMCATIPHLLPEPNVLLPCSVELLTVLHINASVFCLLLVWSGFFRSSDQFLECISCSSGTFSLSPLSIFLILSSSGNFLHLSKPVICHRRFRLNNSFKIIGKTNKIGWICM